MRGRKEARKRLIYYLRVFDRKDESLVGHLVDITPEGFMIITDQPVKVRKPYSLQIDLPKETMGACEIGLEAISRWRRKDTDPAYFRVGFRITEIAPKEAQLVKWLIERYPFEDGEGISYNYNFDVDPPTCR